HSVESPSQRSHFTIAPRRPAQSQLDSDVAHVEGEGSGRLDVDLTGPGAVAHTGIEREATAERDVEAGTDFPAELVSAVGDAAGFIVLELDVFVERAGAQPRAGSGAAERMQELEAERIAGGFDVVVERPLIRRKAVPVPAAVHPQMRLHAEHAGEAGAAAGAEISAG